ncbi:RNA-directed DNA polymerase, eukaryota, partial [Tanacetum coccineum]
LFCLEKNQIFLVRDIIVNGLWAWDWRRPVNGRRALADLNNLLMDIGSLNVEVDRDCVVSTLSTDGSYSVSFIRKHIDNCMIANSFPSTRWCKIIPRKVNIFMWRLLLDRLPHRLNLSSRGLDIDSILCPVCSKHVESNSHAFFSCSTASNIWRLVRGWCDLKIPMLSSYDEWDIWYTSWKASKVEKDRAYVIFAANIARTVASKEDMASQEILHKETKRVKFNSKIIISSKLPNGNKPDWPYKMAAVGGLLGLKRVWAVSGNRLVGLGLPLLLDEENAMRIVGDEELLSNVVEASVLSLNDDSFKRSMLRTVSKVGRGSRVE